MKHICPRPKPSPLPLPDGGGVVDCANSKIDKQTVLHHSLDHWRRLHCLAVPFQVFSRCLTHTAVSTQEHTLNTS